MDYLFLIIYQKRGGPEFVERDTIFFFFFFFFFERKDIFVAKFL